MCDSFGDPDQLSPYIVVKIHIDSRIIPVNRQTGPARIETATAARGRVLYACQKSNQRSMTVESEKTRTGYRRQVEAIVFKPQSRIDRKSGHPREKEIFAVTPVEAIEPPEVNAFIEYQIRARGLHMARASRAVLVQAFSFGRISTRWRLKTNPAAGLRFKRPAGRIVIWTDAEIRHFVDTADRMGMPSIGDSALLGLFTGQRQTDRLGLSDDGLCDGRRQFRQSKTAAIVAIPETPRLRERLEQARQRVTEIKLKRGTRPTAIVVDEATGRDYVLDTYRHKFAEVRAAAAATMPSIAGRRDQDLRDTAVTWLARAGCTIPQIAAITGHEPKSIYGILRHYLAMTPELADAAIDKLVAWMDREGIAV